MENKQKNSILFIILLTIIFGIGGGIAGEILARAYLFQDIYKVPLFGEISVPENVYGGSNLIIESPRKVIVEQNTKILETVNSAKKNIVGIYERIEGDIVDPKLSTIATTTFDFSNFYDLDNTLAQGFVITSDGWIISNYFDQDFSRLSSELATTTYNILKNEILEKYLVITSGGDIYKVIDFEFDTENKISFWRIDANDLSVKQFGNYSDIEKGQLVIATDFFGTAWVTSVSRKYPVKMPRVLSSETSYASLSLVRDLSEDFDSGFLFNVDGDLIALLDKDNSIVPISSYFSCLNCLLEKEELAKPFLGLNYVDLSRYVSLSTDLGVESGALVYKNDVGVAVLEDSPANEAGIIEGDIILSVNTIKLDESNNLSDVLLQFSPGQKVSLTVLREGKERQILVDLGER